MVTLRPITESNRDELEALGVSRHQQRFVSTVAESLIEAAEEPDARAIAWGIYADETPVGFVMIADRLEVPSTSPSSYGSSSSTSGTSDADTARRRSI